MKTNYLYIIVVCGLVFFGSCKKWLDVKPEDRFIEEQVYSNPQGFQDAINGFYINNGASDMYGGNLTMTTMDVLAQYYQVSTINGQYYSMSVYNYADGTSQAIIDDIWRKFYTNILNVNKYIENLDKYGNILTNTLLKRYKGEALGLRAFYYFDLMRMYTMPYTVDSLSKVMPYYDKPTREIAAFQPTSLIMKNVLQDLANAEQLLKDSDPAVSQVRVSKSTSESGRDSRNYQMNYFAVKALQARVNLWKGDKASALLAAKVLIDSVAKFPLTEVGDLSGSQSNRVFATEMILGVENSRLNEIYTANFSPSLVDGDILAPNTTGTFVNNTLFEGNATDYRNQYIWKVDGKTYPTFFKYQNSGPISFNFNRTVPLIRMSEMYLIAAECEPDLTVATNYLNHLRVTRNCQPLTIANTSTLNTAIMKELRKEFCGEGQLFYYYKRVQAATIVAGGTNTDKRMNANNYVFPVPLSENSYR